MTELEGAVAAGGPAAVWSRVREVFAYAAFPMLGAVTPLLALPAISTEFGADGWAAIAVGQSVGAAASVAVELGWGLTGPQAVAASERGSASRIFASSLTSRGAVALGIVPISVAVVVLLQPAHLLAASFAAIAMTMSGLTANWLYLGLGKPSRIFWTDALPRLLSVFGGVVSITVLGAPLFVFAAWLLLGFVSSPLIAMLIERPSRRDFADAETVRAILKRQRVALSGRGLSAVYIGLPVALVQAWAPGAVPAFAAVERLLRMGLLVLQGVPNSFQRTLGRASHDGGGLRSIALKLVFTQACVGGFAAVACFFAMPVAVELIFSGQVRVGWESASLAAVIVLLTCLSRATGMLLIARAQVGWVTVSAGAAAAVAVLLLALLPGEYGPVGALSALAIAECAALVVQGVGLSAGQVRAEPRS